MKLGPYELNTIVTGDARLLAKDIPDNSVDIIFTDPPYAKEFLPLWKWLSATAARVLKPGGSCVALSGHCYLPQIYAMMGEALEYHWTFILETPGQKATVWPRRVSPGWKPLLSYSKGPYNGPWWGVDTLTSTMNDKRFHKWGQSVSGTLAFLSRMPDGALLEPFAGGGTTCVVWGKLLGRRCLAFELDPEVAQLARDRVRDTQPPLPLVMPEQLELSVIRTT